MVRPFLNLFLVLFLLAWRNGIRYKGAERMQQANVKRSQPTCVIWLSSWRIRLDPSHRTSCGFQVIHIFFLHMFLKVNMSSVLNNCSRNDTNSLETADEKIWQCYVKSPPPLFPVYHFLDNHLCHHVNGFEKQRTHFLISNLAILLNVYSSKLTKN